MVETIIQLLFEALTGFCYAMQDYVIFLDEEVIPSADFLNFFRQCFETMTADKTLSGISAWNPYGLYK